MSIYDSMGLKKTHKDSQIKSNVKNDFNGSRDKDGAVKKVWWARIVFKLVNFLEIL